jgi:hypothetical protein
MLKEKLTYFVETVTKLRRVIKNEETTKQSLVLPFLQILGYDPFDPTTIIPEYTADFIRGGKKGEKVDYGIAVKSELVMLLEVKPANEPLQTHDGQLSRYFNSLPNIKFGILSNGLYYKFFSDLSDQNVMDEHPFYEIDLVNLRERDYRFLEQLMKDKFDAKSLIEYAGRVVQTTSNPLRDQIGEHYNFKKQRGRPKTMDVVRLTITVDRNLNECFHDYVTHHNLNKSEIVRHALERVLGEKKWMGYE